MTPAKIVIQTDYGTFTPPDDIQALAAGAKHRKDGRPDRRTKFGKLILAYELAVMSQVHQAWVKKTLAI